MGHKSPLGIITFNDLESKESKMTMVDIYHSNTGEGKDHKFCDKCGKCIECCNCKCNQFKETKPWNETNHIELTIQIDGFPYCVKIALDDTIVKHIKLNLKDLSFYPQLFELEEVSRRVFELMKDRII